MSMIRATLRVDRNGRIEGQVSRDVPPGEHEALLFVPGTRGGPRRRVGDLMTFSGPWPAGFSLRREDMYSDGGR